MKKDPGERGPPGTETHQVKPGAQTPEVGSHATDALEEGCGVAGLVVDAQVIREIRGGGADGKCRRHAARSCAEVVAGRDVRGLAADRERLEARRRRDLLIRVDIAPAR